MLSQVFTKHVVAQQISNFESLLLLFFFVFFKPSVGVPEGMEKLINN